MEENLASYEASSFTVDASKLRFDENGKVVLADFPAFVHEWWHYVQDITTVTGQNGFYLWMRDIVRMINITCSGENKTIQVPLPRDQYGEEYNKYRRFYNDFCGDGSDNERIKGASIDEDPDITPKSFPIDGENRTLAKCEIKVSGRTKYFGLIALQELNAFYAQKIAESYFPDASFTVAADSLPEFPYKVGDLLFDYYHIDCDLRTRFILSSLVLNTLQAPAVFLYLLEALKGRKIEYFNDKEEVTRLFEQICKKHSYPNETAYHEWGKDYSNWLNDESHKMLRESLSWYLSVVGLAERCREEYGFDTIPVALSQGHQFMCIVYSCFPVPLIKIGEEIMSQDIDGSKPLSIATKHDFENALTIWSHRRIYDLLRSTKRKDFQDLSSCPIYRNGNCQYLKNYDTDKRYDCMTAPWMVVRGEKQAKCPYAVAAHSMGLWQNELEINVE